MESATILARQRKSFSQAVKSSIVGECSKLIHFQPTAYGVALAASILVLTATWDWSSDDYHCNFLCMSTYLTSYWQIQPMIQDYRLEFVVIILPFRTDSSSAALDDRKSLRKCL